MNRFLNEQNVVIKSTMLSDACEVTFNTILNFADDETSYRFKKAFYIYSQLLRNPRINPTNVQAAQKVLLSKIRRESDDPRILAEQEFKKLVFGKNHPQSSYPTKHSIESVTLKDLYNFHRQYFQPNRIILAISGSFDDNKMIKLIKKFFGSWKNKKAIYTDIPDVVIQRSSFHFFEKNVAQTSLIIGHIGPHIPHKNCLPLLLANEILGKATLSNRLFKRIRSQLGLVYFINSKIESNPFSQGMIKISCQTDEKKSIRALYETKRVLERFVNQKVTEKELRQVKQSYLNSLTTSLNSYHKIVQYFSLHEHYGFAPNFLYLFIQNINKITSDDILRVAQQYMHPDHLIMVMVGKSPNFKNPILPRLISDDAIYHHSNFR